MKRYPLCLTILVAVFALHCAKHHDGRRMIVTAYCGCGTCCHWMRGSPRYHHLDFWNRTISRGPHIGHRYKGLTAGGTIPQSPRKGLFSMDSLQRPWMIPVRVIFIWRLPSRDGTVAADPEYIPPGTRFYIAGYGYGIVADRGSAIKGPNRLDIFFDDHAEAVRWGRRKVLVELVD